MKLMVDTTVVRDGLHFAESPSEGPDGLLYVSDFYAHEVLRIDPRTWSASVAATVPAQPSGLGWLPDGRMLVVSMRDLKLLRLEENGSLSVHADLSPVARGAANDMKVDAQGRAWVGSFGFDFYGLLEADPNADPLFGPGANPPTADIACVRLDGTVSCAAQGLQFPNGTVQLSDGTLMIAETVGTCLTAFSIDPAGKLTDRRIWADLSELGPDGDRVLPDGICADAEDGIWVSDPAHSRAIRLDRHGRVTDRIRTSQPCFAVGLSGPDGRTLICCTAETSNPNIAATRRTGKLEAVRVAVGRQA
ncbi:SMP-30/gluconolactonase/LRE family protein [Paraburkholderia phenazinium]|jgi:sugar lactone lactonase YvrE|uniref:Sugar lactone lactonase YvrE n=1 Tax=Paraburkholderia phenazinium TaxID=60549 RepID=A0A1N6LGX9_9BURK|nr:SMP-30/gluconolactonase/LRE family protein [Paraburkholderia phenazinium]SIO68070.1 Sugar lactone lactonase YvrE [Paraburkholderia phenazinium]